MVGYNLRESNNHTLKAILVVKENSPLIKVIEFYLNLEGNSYSDSQNRLLTITGDGYEFIIGNKEAMYGFSGVGIRKGIEKKIPQRYVALISSHERIQITDKGLEEFLLPIVCEGEIIGKVESSVNLFAKGEL